MDLPVGNFTDVLDPLLRKHTRHMHLPASKDVNFRVAITTGLFALPENSVTGTLSR